MRHWAEPNERFDKHSHAINEDLGIVTKDFHIVELMGIANGPEEVTQQDLQTQWVNCTNP